MNNKKELSRRERILLSAYIDGQLSGRDKEKVERLLRDSSAHRAWMEDLRRTKAVIGMLPVRRVRRRGPARPDSQEARRRARDRPGRVAVPPDDLLRARGSYLV